MKCPFCKEQETRVIDTRIIEDGYSIKRRRECPTCGRRFTTFERIEERYPYVIKRDGRREPYSREKVMGGLRKAFHKRAISAGEIERIADEVEKYILSTGRREIPSKLIGEKIMELLKITDEVAYVRFASVYREFKDTDDFIKELEDLKRRKGDR
ncbi:MAG: transcriptional regulator NrdR [Thermosulfidibacteraceae bacterium]|jgi:transcriptional repressor NrdR